MRNMFDTKFVSIASSLFLFGLVGLATTGCQHATSDDGSSSETSGSLDKDDSENDGTAAGNKADRAGGSTGSSYDPCAGKACGERCTQCAPNDPDCVETQVLKYCQSDGSCAATTPQCGGNGGGSAGCTSQSDCGPDSFCESSQDGTCSPNLQGTCSPVPQFCTLEYNPVCGCDGQTYDNRCHAHAAGVNVEHSGECSGGGSGGNYDPCAGKTCGERCTVCAPNDPNCVETEVVKYCQPDGSCSALAPRCSGGGGGTNGCTSDSECGSDEYCEKVGASSCSTGTTGTCETKPQFCTQEYDPVCGCNGTTYSNPCMAKSAGVNIAHDGRC